MKQKNQNKNNLRLSQLKSKFSNRLNKSTLDSNICEFVKPCWESWMERF